MTQGAGIETEADTESGTEGGAEPGTDADTGTEGRAPDMPPGVGPHEGRELDLMLAGQKPLAMFCDVGPLAGTADDPAPRFAPHVTAGRLVMREVWETTPDGRHAVRHLVYALPTEAWRIDAALALSRLSCAPGDRVAAAAACARMGRLLGYTEAEIRAFLAWVDRLRAE